MARCAEAPKPKSPTRSPCSHSGYPKAAKTDDAAHNRGAARKSSSVSGRGNTKSDAGQRIFCISAIHGIAGKGGRIAQVFKTVLAIPALPVNPADPGNSNASAQRKVRRAACGDLAHDLVTGNQSLAKRWEFAFDDVQIGPADAAGPHSQKDLPGRGRGLRNLLNPEEGALKSYPARSGWRLSWRNSLRPSPGRLSVLAPLLHAVRRSVHFGRLIFLSGHVLDLPAGSRRDAALLHNNRAGPHRQSIQIAQKNLPRRHREGNCSPAGCRSSSDFRSSSASSPLHVAIES